MTSKDVLAPFFNTIVTLKNQKEFQKVQKVFCFAYTGAILKLLKTQKRGKMFPKYHPPWLYNIIVMYNGDFLEK